MFRILARAFAVIGFLVTVSIISGIILGIYASKKAKEPESVVLRLDLDRPIVEQVDPTPFDFALNDKPPVSLINILSAIDAARVDPHVKGIVARFGSTAPSLSDAQEIRAAIARFRTSGKFTYAYAVSYGDFGMSSRPYYLASAFENIWLQPVGAVGLTGIAIQSPFARSALAKWGVKGDFMQREEYKSAMDMYTQDNFTLPVRTMMQNLIGDMADQIAGGIGESRGWPIERVKTLMARGPYTSSEALKEGLVTTLGFTDTLDEEINSKAGKDAKPVSVEQMIAFADNDKAKFKNAPTIALIYASGLIVEKPSGVNRVSGDKGMDIEKVVEALNTAAKDKNVKAVLFRIDSPGGSPDASETIRHALIRAKEAHKPVFVSMGSVAASGGYWIAMDADHIIANPASMTGSIGVVGGKYVIRGLSDKLGVNWGTLKTDENAGMWSMADDFSTGQRNRVNALLDETYKTFTQGVAAGRKIAPEKIPDIAKGRVWSGQQAIKVGLVDELGGYDTAFKALRKKLNLAEDAPLNIQQYPRPQNLAEKLMKIMRGGGLPNGISGILLNALSMEWRDLLAQVFEGNAKAVNVRVPDFIVQSVK